MRLSWSANATEKSVIFLNYRERTELRFSHCRSRILLANLSRYQAAVKGPKGRRCAHRMIHQQASIVMEPAYRGKILSLPCGKNTDISAFVNRIQAFERAPTLDSARRSVWTLRLNRVLSGGPMPTKVYLKLKFTLNLTPNFRALGI